MLNFLFKPKLLISSVEKVEIEREMISLLDFFGEREFENIEFEDPDNPEWWIDDSTESFERLVGLICEKLDIETERIRVVFSLENVDSNSGLELLYNFDEATDPETKLLNERFRVDMRVGRNLILEHAIAETLRALMKVKLILSRYCEVQSPQLDYSGEVATAMWGFGLFTINETVSCCQTTSQLSSYFSIRKLGAINSFGLGYLLALIVWKQNHRENLENRLRPDARHSYKKSLAFLEKTGDTILADPQLMQLSASSSLSTLAAELRTDSATKIIWILGLIERRPNLNRDVTEIQPTLFQLLRHSDLFVCQLTLHLLSFAEKFDASEIRVLLRLARSRDEWISAVSTNILSQHLSFSELENDFARLLERSDHSAAVNAAQIANRYGKIATRFEASVCDRIRVALNRCDFSLGKFYALTLLGISNDARQQVSSYFSGDAELLRGSIELLDDAMNVTEIGLNESEEKPTELKDLFHIPAWINL